MAKRSRKSSRRQRRTRKMKGGSMVTTGQRGGGWGFTGASSIPGVPGTVSNPQVFTGIGDCRATEPGYWIPESSYAEYQKGLPGMNGGRRRRTNRKQRGGRYTFDLSPPSVNGVAPNAAAWWAGTYPPVQRIACEGSTPNPLNPGPHTPSTQPLPVASANLHLNPQSGGASVATSGTVGVGDVDSMYYYAPTAGYDNKPSTWVDSVGAPVQLQIPFAARQMNPACLTTGHPPPLTGALQKGGGVLNTLKSGVRKITNTIGLTRKNNNLAGNVGAVYENIGAVNSNVNALAKNTTQLNVNLGNVYKKLNTVESGNALAKNLSNETNVSRESAAAAAAAAALVAGASEPYEGGKRSKKGRKSRKASRKARKARKH